MYTVNYADGTDENYATYDDAVAMVEKKFPGAVTGHGDDMNDGGYRTLCWATREDSMGDDGGETAVAIISLGSVEVK